MYLECYASQISIPLLFGQTALSACCWVRAVTCCRVQLRCTAKQCPIYCCSMFHWHAGGQQQHRHPLSLAHHPQAFPSAAGCFIGTLMGTMTKLNPEAQKALTPQPPGGASPEMAQRMQVSAAAMFATETVPAWTTWCNTRSCAQHRGCCAVSYQVLRRCLAVHCWLCSAAGAACCCSFTSRSCLQHAFQVTCCHACRPCRRRGPGCRPATLRSCWA